MSEDLGATDHDPGSLQPPRPADATPRRNTHRADPAAGGYPSMTRVGASDRARATDKLQAALDEHRIDFAEYDEAKSQVDAARTRQDLRSALSGYVGPRDTAREVTNRAASVAETSRQLAAEGGRRLAASALRGTGSFLLLVLAIVLAVMGQGLAAFVIFCASLGLGFLSVRALFVASR